MRRIYRSPLPPRTQTYLDQRRIATANLTNVGAVWKNARKTKALRTVVRTLQSMAGTRERCMYCVDSHGSDIEHFWPKSSHIQKVFEWSNMLLCCTECGRIKGDRFPLLPDGQPVLVDPSAEDPWEHLDFDPDTGNITARFDLASGSLSERGLGTVRLLQLDRREAITEGYRRTYQRLADRVNRTLAGSQLTAPSRLAAELMQLDEHGLLGWCFGPIGSQIQPFAALRLYLPDNWNACVAAAR